MKWCGEVHGGVGVRACDNAWAHDARHSPAAAEAGLLVVASSASLPAATVTTTPEATALFTAVFSAMDSSPPRDMLSTFRAWEEGGGR